MGLRASGEVRKRMPVWSYSNLFSLLLPLTFTTQALHSPCLWHQLSLHLGSRDDFRLGGWSVHSLIDLAMEQAPTPEGEQRAPLLTVMPPRPRETVELRSPQATAPWERLTPVDRDTE